MDIVVVGIDLGNNSCSLAGLDASGRVILRSRMWRSSVEGFVKGLGRCIVAIVDPAVPRSRSLPIEALSPRIRLLIEELRSEWRALDERVAAFDAEFVRMAREDEAVRR